MLLILREGKALHHAGGAAKLCAERSFHSNMHFTASNARLKLKTRASHAEGGCKQGAGETQQAQAEAGRCVWQGKVAEMAACGATFKVFKHA